LDSGLVFTDQALLINEDGLDLISHGAAVDTVLFYPAQPNVPSVSGAVLKSISFPATNFSACEIDFAIKKINEGIEKPMERNAVIHVDPAALQDLNDLYIEVDYAGDKAQAFLDGKLIADHFYYGAPWEIGLKRFYKNLKSKPLYLYFHPLIPGAACLDYLTGKVPPLSNGKEYFKINSIHFIPEYKCRLTMLR